MKSIIYHALAALLVALTLSACGTVQQESAMEWLQRQPVLIDP